jgi:hypothetical protein
LDPDYKKNKKKIKELGLKDIIDLYQLVEKDALARFFIDEKPEFVVKNLAKKLKALKKKLKETNNEHETAHK